MIGLTIGLLINEWGAEALIPVAVGGGAAFLLIYPTMILRKYVGIIINVLDDVASTSASFTEAGRWLDGEVVAFPAADGHPLEGVLMNHPGDQAARGMIVFAHEFGSDRGSCLRYMAGLLDAGYDVFTFDFRGHGASQPEHGYKPRQWPSDRERDDLRGAIGFVLQLLAERGRPGEVGLFGLSRGGGAALLAAVGMPQVNAIITDGAYSSDTTMEYLMRRFARTFAKIQVVARNHPAFVWRILRWLLFRECRRRFHCDFPSVRKAVSQLGDTPILFIHGGRDSYIPIEQSQDLYDLARGPRELWIVRGARHNQSVVLQPKLYATRLRNFFDKHLGGSTSCETPCGRWDESCEALAHPNARVLVGSGSA